jgi:hypothetical protein
VSAKPLCAPRTCAVCGVSDVRVLVDVALTKREAVVLCGSHAVMRERVAPTATSVDELRAAMKDRRLPVERRGRADRTLGEIDELGVGLTAAFAGERRATRARRAG